MAKRVSSPATVKDVREIVVGTVGKILKEVQKNRKGLDRNRGTIERNRKGIDKNQALIQQNQRVIKQNLGAIKQNLSAIQQNRRSIKSIDARLANVEGNMASKIQVKKLDKKIDGIERSLKRRMGIHKNEIVAAVGKLSEKTPTRREFDELEARVDRHHPFVD